jgi:hypothetical protein
VHLKLPTELHTKGDPPVCSVRGPPVELFPWDVSETRELLFEASDRPSADAVGHDPAHRIPHKSKTCQDPVLYAA